MCYCMCMLDPTLQLDETMTPGPGVHGKTLSSSESGWGGTLQNSSQIRSRQVDTLEKDVIKLPEFYESPMDLLSFEDRALVNPKDLAKKLLSKVEYSKSYGADMLEFFLAKEKYRISMDVHYRKDGEMLEKERHIPNAPPQFSEFGRTIGVSERTLKSWVKKYPEFGEAYEICQDIIQEFFVENGVKGDYASQFAIFAAKNLTKMKDVMVNKNENYDMKAVLDAIEKGIISES